MSCISDYLKVAISEFAEKNILRNCHTYVIINASYGGICVEFERKNNPTLVLLLSNCPKILNIFDD